MKKYLMFAAAAVLTFASCTKNEDVSLTPEQQTHAKFDDLFLKTYGEPASNQTWGFGATKGATRGGDANGNQWALNYYVPSPLTDAQKKAVTDWFKANRNPNGVSVNYTEYFAQQVSSNKEGVPCRDGQNTIVPGSQMDYLCAYGSSEHIYNFNNGDQGTYENVMSNWLKPGTEGQDINNRYAYYPDKISHMYNSSTQSFSYHNSVDNGTYENFVIIPGYVIDPNNQYGIGDRYFVGFDYQANGQNGNQQADLDGYFFDWIICITPGFHKPESRIIAEDLGTLENGSDLDYNDVVFDAEITAGGARIVLLAAGGTLPLYIGSEEVHGKFGVSTGTMVNTNASKNGAVRPIVEFNISGTFSSVADIPVRVVKGDQTLVLKCTAGEPAEKICVSKWFQWTNERQALKDKYSRFVDYVSDPNVAWY